MTAIKYRTADVDGFNLFYREVGAAGAPKLLLLHGFPSASHMFRDLIPLLADRFHIVAPDLPGFGRSDLPGRGHHTFERIAETIAAATPSGPYPRSSYARAPRDCIRACSLSETPTIRLLRTMFVLMIPGQIADTPIPSDASSARMHSDSISTAALVVA